MNRIIAIRKPRGPTSHDIVDAVRRITGERRVGHAGTLDPLASGVLVIGIGRGATKQLASIVAKEKEYRATMVLGATSTTDDAEGEREATQNAKRKTQSEVERVIRKFIGTIRQVPPQYSAIKINGRPAYRRARRGEEVHLKPRTVEIKEIELLRYAWPLDRRSRARPSEPWRSEGEDGELELRVVCGPGTYMRSLARDIGARLGVGGYLSALERTRVGSFTLDRALELEEFKRQWVEQTIAPRP